MEATGKNKIIQQLAGIILTGIFCIGITLGLPIIFSSYATIITLIFSFVLWYFNGTKNLINNRFWLLLLAALFIIKFMEIFFRTPVMPYLNEAKKSLPLLVIPAIIFSQKITQHTFHKFLVYFIISTVIICISCWLYNLYIIYDTGDPIEYFTRYRYSYHNLTRLTGVQVNYFAIYVLTALGALLYLSEQSELIRNKKKWLWSGSIIFTLFIFHSNSRMAIILLFVLAIIQIYKLRKTKFFKKAILSLVGLTILFLTCLVYMPFLQKRLFKRTIDFTNKNGEIEIKLKGGRFTRWKVITPLLYDRPLTGWGAVQGNKKIVDQYKQHNLEHAIKKEYNAHNQFLQYGITHGFPGLLIFTINLFLPLWYFRKKLNWFYIFFIIIFTSFCMVESALERNKGIVYYALFQSMFIVHHLSETKNKTRFKGN